MLLGAAEVVVIQGICATVGGLLRDSRDGWVPRAHDGWLVTSARGWGTQGTSQERPS